MLNDILKAVRAESHDTNTKAAGKQAAGAAMVADGLFGLENPLDGKESRVGIGGALMLAVVGLILMAGGYFIGRAMFSADDGDVVVSGVVVDFTESTRTRDDRTSTMFSPVVEYTDPATGETYRTGTGWSSSSRPTIGDDVEVAFPTGNPAGGKVLSRTGNWIAWGVVGFGALLFLIGAGTFVVRLFTIGFGIKLFLDGRRQRKEAGDDRSVVAALVDGAQDVLDDVSGGQPPSGSGGGQTMLDRITGGALGGITSGTTVPGSAAGSAAIPPPPGGIARQPGPPAETSPAPPLSAERISRPSTPPPGWYTNPTGPGYRWWDGAAWTEHVHRSAT